MRVSKASVSGGASIDTSTLQNDDADDELFAGASVNPEELMARLCALAAASNDQLDPAHAHRVHAALLRGNVRPYRTELNRLTNRFVERLESAWRLNVQ